jgi:hypothetical protein
MLDAIKMKGSVNYENGQYPSFCHSDRDRRRVSSLFFSASAGRVCDLQVKMRHVPWGRRKQNSRP